MQYNYNIRLHAEPEGGFTVTVPALPGCVTYGENTEEAVDNAQEAIALYLEELQVQEIMISDDSSTMEYALNLATA